jgi:DNA-directed RNA polymerase specialized sigma24 family protein
MSGMQTGGSERHWLFDPTRIQDIGPLRDAFVHHDTYFGDGPEEDSTLSIALDWILAELPDILSQAVRLVYLQGMSYRAAAKEIGVDHKTVISRCKRGTKMMETKLLETAWVAEMLRGYLPESETSPSKSQHTAGLAAVIDLLRYRDDK